VDGQRQGERRDLERKEKGKEVESCTSMLRR